MPAIDSPQIADAIGWLVITQLANITSTTTVTLTTIVKSEIVSTRTPHLEILQFLPQTTNKTAPAISGIIPNSIHKHTGQKAAYIITKPSRINDCHNKASQSQPSGWHIHIHKASPAI